MKKLKDALIFTLGFALGDYINDVIMVFTNLYCVYVVVVQCRYKLYYVNVYWLLCSNRSLNSVRDLRNAKYMCLMMGWVA